MLHCECSMAGGYSSSCQSMGHGADRSVYSWPPACSQQKLSSNLLILNRVGIRVITRMLTLHSGFNDNMYRMGRQPSPLCSRCGESREIPSHLFENCVTMAAVKVLHLWLNCDHPWGGHAWWRTEWAAEVCLPCNLMLLTLPFVVTQPPEVFCSLYLWS